MNQKPHIILLLQNKCQCYTFNKARTMPLPLCLLKAPFYVLLFSSMDFESLNPEQQIDFPACVSQHRFISLITSSHMCSRYLLAARSGDLAKRQCGKCFLTTCDGIKLAIYLVNTAEWHKLAFDTDLSVA